MANNDNQDLFKQFEAWRLAQSSASMSEEKKPRNQASWGRRPTKTKKPMPKTNVGSVRGQKGTFPEPGEHLSKVASEVKNDPLSDAAYFPSPSEEFREVADRQKIYSGCDALPALLEETFKSISVKNPSYQKTVPRSLHDLYFATLTYGRLLYLQKKNYGNLTFDEEQFVSNLDEANYVVPKSVQIYLSGFGNTAIPSGRNVLFTMHKPGSYAATLPGPCDLEFELPGFFGPITDNLGVYSSYPCLAVYWQRLYEDMMRTRDQQRPANWDLPDDFRAEGHPINRNCLGYSPATILRPEQRQTLGDANFNIEVEEGFRSINPGIPFSPELMSTVQTKLLGTRDIKMVPVGNSSTGSMGQLPLASVSRQSGTVLLDAQITATASFRVPGPVGYLGSSFLYRFKKTYDELRITKTVMPIHYRPNQAIPVEQRMNLDLLHLSNDPFINYRKYEVVDFSPIIRIEGIVDKDSV